MKHLKSTIRDLRGVFNHSVSVRYLAEPLVAFDIQRLASDIRSFMDEKDFDIVGVRDCGAVIGYVNRTALKDDTLEKHVRPFDEQIILEDWRPMLDVLQRLEKSPHVLVLVMGEIFGIITKGDLQKAPMRMWLFGIFSLLEMQFLRLIREAYPQDSWIGLISAGRLNKVQQLLKDRQQRKEAIDLADCLQFADKRDIILKTDCLRHALGFNSKKKGQRLLKDLEHLRDELAHAQDIISGRWPKLVELAGHAEELLKNCEGLEPAAQ